MMNCFRAGRSCLLWVMAAAFQGVNLLHAQTSPEILWSNTRHSDRVNCVRFFPDGQKLVSGGSDRMIHFWRASDGQLLKSYKSGESNVIQNAVLWLALSPDARRLATVSYQKVKLWNLEDDTVQELDGHSDYVLGASFHPTEPVLATGDLAGQVRLWNATNGAPLQVLATGLGGIRTTEFSPDGRYLAAGGNNKIHLWRVSDWSQVHTFIGHESDIMNLAFSPDGKTLASGSIDKTVRLWNVDTGETLHTLTGHLDHLYALAFTPDGKRLISADGAGNTMKVWQIPEGTLLHTFTENVPMLTSVAYSQAGLLAYGRRDQTLVMSRLPKALLPLPVYIVKLQSAGPGHLEVEPAPDFPDGTYTNGTLLVVRAVAEPGQKLLSWEGAPAGKATNMTLRLFHPEGALWKLENGR